MGAGDSHGGRGGVRWVLVGDVMIMGEKWDRCWV